MSTRALIVAVTLALAAIIPAAARAADPNVRWADIVGIIQAGNAVGSGTGQVLGGAQPWSTTKGSATVNLNTGDIRFRVEGLVLAGGNAIGTRGTITEVRGTLVCDTDGSAGSGNSTLVDTTLVPLSAQGDAEFNGSVGPLPGACLAESDIAFLVRIGGSGRWIANGAVRRP
jgi:hypothetical protein